MRDFQRIQTEDEELRRVQDNVGVAFKPLARCPVVDGLLVAGDDGMGVALVTGQANYVAHGLQRRCIGWMLVSPGADVRVWEDVADVSPDAEALLVLRCSANVTTKLWVF